MRFKLQLITFSLLTLLFGFFFTHNALAANYVLSGSVKDNTGAVVGSATLHVYNVGTSIDVVPPVTSDPSTGSYAFTSVPQGTYDIKVIPASGSNFSSDRYPI